jgi:ATP-dependent DNA helicase PIF1
MREAGADPEDEEPIPIEYLRAIQSSNLPPGGELNLKVGAPVILLRNLAPSRGLCNGTRMIITCMKDRVLEARLIGGEHDGEIVMIPRISMVPTTSAKFTFRFKQLQFPVCLAFMLSINKAQGQSVHYIGIHLAVPVFAHGQLYVALSHVTCSQNVKIFLGDNTVESMTNNVVYDEVLL